MRSVKTIGYVAVMAFSLWLTASANETPGVIVKGSIMTGNGTPLQGFPVIIEGKSNVFVTTTDHLGGFSTRKLPSDQYMFRLANTTKAAKQFKIRLEAPEWYEPWGSTTITIEVDGDTEEFDEAVVTLELNVEVDVDEEFVNVDNITVNLELEVPTD